MTTFRRCVSGGLTLAILAMGLSPAGQADAPFGPNLVVSSDMGNILKGDPDVAVAPDGPVYVAWTDLVLGNPDVYLSRSEDGGLSFSPPSRIDDGPGATNQTRVQMAVDASGTLHVVWADGRNDPDGLANGTTTDIYYRRSTTTGVSFEPSIRISDPPAAAFRTAPRIAVRGNQVHVAWGEGIMNWPAFSPYNISYASSDDQGLTWGPSIQVNGWSAGVRSGYPDITTNATGSALIVWEDNRDAPAEGIFFSQSDDGTPFA